MPRQKGLPSDTENTKGEKLSAGSKGILFLRPSKAVRKDQESVENAQKNASSCAEFFFETLPKAAA